jgi:NADH:ubiquinone oxidoreductase subunit 5 (subunit L)/multisubunit Na+/H+ antiporter MnhA subunit
MNLKIIYFISLLTIFSASLRAILECDFKKIVAFSTLSQVGFLFLIVRNFKFLLCFFHLFSHAFFKRMLFISVGNFLHSSNRSQERRSFLKNKKSNLSAYLILNLRILNLIGLIFSRGF